MGWITSQEFVTTEYEPWLGKTKSLAGSTKDNYHSVLWAQMPVTLLDATVDTISRRDLQEALDEAADLVGPDLQDKLRTVISSIFKLAEDRGFVDASSAVGLKVNTGDAPDERDEEIDLDLVLDFDQVYLIASAIDPGYPSGRVLVLTLAFTGIRIGEAAALRWMDINLEKGWMKISRSQSRATMRYSASGKTKEIKKPKTENSKRKFKIPPALVEVLKGVLAANPDATPSDLVFTSPMGMTLDPNHFTSRHWKDAVAEVGLEGYVPHDLRHTCATWLLSSGKNPKAVAEHLGDTVETIMKVYAGCFPGDEDAIAASLDKEMRRAMRSE